MATNFPTGLDSLTNPTSTDTLASPSHSAQHANANDAIEALQAKVGVNSSAVTTSLDYLVRNIDASTAVVSGSSAGDLVRITQTGAGNALVVEDSANPDSSPFVINASGQVGIGAAPTAGRTLTVSQPITGATSGIAVFSNGEVQSDVTASASMFRTLATTQNAVFTLPTIRHFLAAQGALGASSTVTEQIGFLADSSLTGAGTNIGFYGNIASGTNRWNLYMGGTAANYLAGRLGVGATLTSGAMAQITNTTAADKAFVVKGAASQSGDFIDIQNSAGTSQFKIDSAGQVGIGSTTTAGQNLRIAKNLTGGTTARAVVVSTTVQSDVTSVASGYSTFINTDASAFTFTSLTHYLAQQGTIGATSSVTNQHGFFVDASLTGASNNYGFVGNLAAATGRWNLHMGGTAANYLAGRLGVGATLTSGSMMQVTNTTAADIALTVKGAASQSGLLLDIENSAGTSLVVVDASGKVGIGTSTPATPAGYGAITTDGTTGSLLYQYVNGVDTFRVQTTATSATLNTIAAIPIVFATNNVERMRLDTTGALGLGSGAIAAGRRLVVSGSLTGAVTSVGLSVVPTIQSDVTSNAYIVNTNGITSAASFTLAALHHFRADQGTFGAGSTVTEQIGFVVGSSLTGATNNFGFYSSLASATGRWNLYMTGTAANYLAGRLGVGATLTSGAMAQITNTTASDKAFIVKGAASQSGNLLEAQNSGGTALVIIDSAGKVGIGNTAPENTLDVTGSFGRGNPAVKTGNFTLAGTENWIICNGTGTITATLPTPSTCDGREFGIKTVAPQTVVSASSNVIAIGGGAAGTAILPATSGAWAILVSDGSNWNIMCRGT